MKWSKNSKRSLYLITLLFRYIILSFHTLTVISTRRLPYTQTHLSLSLFLSRFSYIHAFTEHFANHKGDRKTHRSFLRPRRQDNPRGCRSDEQGQYRSGYTEIHSASNLKGKNKRQRLLFLASDLVRVFVFVCVWSCSRLCSCAGGMCVRI